MEYNFFTANSTWLISALIYGVIFAFACMAIAGAKGYSRASWWFIGLILGIIGLIIIACFPSKETSKELPKESSKSKYRNL